MLGQRARGRQAEELGPQQPLDAVALQEVVRQADEEAGGAGVALAAGPAAQLIVDPPALVAVGADHIEPAQGDDLLPVALARPAEPDVGAPPRQVGRDGHRAGGAGLGDDLRLLAVVPGVQHPAGDPGRPEIAEIGEIGGEALRLKDAHRADEDRPAAFVDAGDLLAERPPLRLAAAVEPVGMIDTDPRPVGGDGEHVETVDLRQLGGGGQRRAGHAAEARVLLHEELEGDRVEASRAGDPAPGARATSALPSPRSLP
ncbi:MAG TPA: hypothetical protein VFE33_09430 [Thermoanaerobaculia bacterium]|nr:hypothetical protein [Thermoanaerobaculia bacterium]